MMDNKDSVGLVRTLLDVGEELLLSGAEIYRVEDTVSRMGKAFGAAEIDIFVITSSIILTLTDAEGRIWTQSRRVRKPAGTDFTKLEKLNSISRACCAGTMSLKEMEEKLRELKGKKPDGSDLPERLAGSALVGFGLTIFFGGSLLDGIVGGLGGILICLMQEHIEKYCPNRIIFNLISGFIVGSIICLAANMLPFLHEDKIMIGDIMIQIPGLAATISLRDVLVGETISGELRLIESLMWAGSLACGWMLSIWLVLR